jgi:hypothetical protein
LLLFSILNDLMAALTMCNNLKGKFMIAFVKAQDEGNSTSSSTLPGGSTLSPADTQGGVSSGTAGLAQQQGKALLSGRGSEVTKAPTSTLSHHLGIRTRKKRKPSKRHAVSVEDRSLFFPRGAQAAGWEAGESGEGGGMGGKLDRGKREAVRPPTGGPLAHKRNAESENGPDGQEHKVL